MTDSICCRKSGACPDSKAVMQSVISTWYVADGICRMCTMILLSSGFKATLATAGSIMLQSDPRSIGVDVGIWKSSNCHH
jgi:hypothetical protein